MSDHMFFKDEGYEFATRCAIGAVAYRLAEAGEVTSTAARITDGDPDSWFDEWVAVGDRLLKEAHHAEREGDPVTARYRYLRAATYMGTGFFYVLGTKDPSRGLSTWRHHREAIDHAFRLWPTPVEKVKIPYEKTHLHGYFMSGGEGVRPLVILTNGSDGTVSDMLSMGGMDALERGYHVLIYDGPGQGYALYEQHMPFRGDWEAVATPVVDWALARGDVQADAIALSGVSQAGYWVPRAAAFEHRLAAIIIDPGVVDVMSTWKAKLPPQLWGLFESGDDATFDTFFNQATSANPGLAAMVAKRMEPYRTDSMAAVLHEQSSWDVKSVASQITCPALITSPDDEQFWPGQSQALFDLLPMKEKVLVPFPASEGTNWHCEPMGLQVRNERVYDWLATVMPRPPA
ncbi:MAG: CocE/NonD family hydrolase [Thermoleophilia bacterium]